MHIAHLLDRASAGRTLVYDSAVVSLLGDAPLPQGSGEIVCHVVVSDAAAPVEFVVPEGPDGTECVLLLQAAASNVPFRAWARALARGSYQILEVVADAGPDATVVALRARRTTAPLPLTIPSTEAMIPPLPSEQQALYAASHAAVLELELIASTSVLVAELQHTIDQQRQQWDASHEERRAGERARMLLEGYRASATYRVGSVVRRVRRRVAPASGK